MHNASAIDRLTIRKRPPDRPLMFHTWDKLLFLHWPIEASRLRPLIPTPLEIDTFDGVAWIGVVPFTMRGIRPQCVPALPWASRSHELNVRTYVHADGVPGVWFLSLDAANPLIVWGARASYHLPYFRANMDLQSYGATVRFRSERTHRNAPLARFEATWELGDAIPETQPDSLEFFLTERYCLYAARRERLYRAAIHHRPWPLCHANVTHWRSTMTESLGLDAVEGTPLIHALAEPLVVDVWPLKRIKRRAKTLLGNASQEASPSRVCHRSNVPHCLRWKRRRRLPHD